MQHFDTLAVGLASGAVSVAVPDGIVSDFNKILVGVGVALISGSVHSLVKWLWGRLAKKGSS